MYDFKKNMFENVIEHVKHMANQRKRASLFKKLKALPCQRDCSAPDFSETIELEYANRADEFDPKLAMLLRKVDAANKELEDYVLSRSEK